MKGWPLFNVLKALVIGWAAIGLFALFAAPPVIGVLHLLRWIGLLP